MDEAYREDGRDWKAEALGAQEELSKLKALKPFKLQAWHVLGIISLIVSATIMAECAAIQLGGTSPLWLGVRACFVIFGVAGVIMCWVAVP